MSADDQLASTLAEIRERAEYAKEYMQGDPMPQSLDDVPRLLAAIDAVLKLHVMQEKPVRSYDKPCPEHAFNPETRRFGSFESVRDCPDCRYTEYYVCFHCECPNDNWPCPTVRAISTALTGQETGKP